MADPFVHPLHVTLLTEEDNEINDGAVIVTDCVATQALLLVTVTV